MKVSPARFQRTLALHTEVLVKRIRKHLSDDLRLKDWRGHPHSLAGHCYIASEALYHLTGGSTGPWKPMWIRHDDGDDFDVGHWFLQNRDTGEILDITAAQFKRPVNYENGRGRGFMTRRPSARTQELLRRVEKDHELVTSTSVEKVRRGVRGKRRT